MYVFGGGDSSQHLRFLAFQLQPFAGDESGASVGNLDNNRRIDRSGRFEHGIDGIGSGYIDCRDGKSFFFGIGEQLPYFVAGENPCRKFFVAHYRWYFVSNVCLFLGISFSKFTIIFRFCS